MTFAAYFPALHAGYIWDDNLYVTENAALRTAKGLWDIWFVLGTTPQYYPLVFTTFWLEFRLWGDDATGYHAVNILLHAVNALLVWTVLRRLAVPGAWIAAAIFAIHPVHVESAAWITERKNVLSGMLYLIAMLAYMRFAPFGPSSESRSHQWKFYAVSLLAFFGALCSKTVTCSLPAAILLVMWWKQPEGTRLRLRDVLPLIPMFAMGLAMASITAWMERTHVGAVGPDWDFSFIDRLLIAGRAVWFYLWSLVMPVNHSFIYSRWAIDSNAWWQYAFPVATALLVIVLWMVRRRLGKGPLVAALFFGGTLLPALGFFNVYPMLFSFVADHFQYLASIGPVALFAAMASALHRRWIEPSPRALIIARGVAVLALCGLGVLTFQQARVYATAETLWRDTLKKNPQAWIAHNNLSVELYRQRRFEDSAEHAQSAISIYSHYGRAHNNLGLALEALGRDDDALEHYRLAIEADPHLVNARLNQAGILFRRGALDAAEDVYRAAVQQSPNVAAARYNLAVLLASTGRFDNAKEQCRAALELNAHDADSHCLLGYLLLQSGESEQGINEVREALRIDPAHERAKTILEAMSGP